LPVPVLAGASILVSVTNLYSNEGAGAAPGAPAPRGASPVFRKRPSGPRTRVAALVAACAVVAGGAFAITDAVSGSGSAAPPAATAGTATGLTGQAAVLNGALSDASFSSSASTSAQSTPAATRAAVRRVHRALARLRLLGGMHGEFTFKTKEGPRTLAFERGTVISVAGPDVTVRAADGTMWTWVVTGTSVVREDGTRTSAAALADGQSVFAGGSVTGATRDALLLVIRTPAKKPA
jgi:hypothetical protein